jgi:predicted Zn-dependent protease
MNNKILEFIKQQKQYEWQLSTWESNNWEIKLKKSKFELDKKKINLTNDLNLFKDNKSMSLTFKDIDIKEFKEKFQIVKDMLKNKKDKNKTQLSKSKKIKLPELTFQKHNFKEQEIKDIIIKIDSELRKNNKISKDNIDIGFSSSKVMKTYTDSNKQEYKELKSDSSYIFVSYVFYTEDNFKLTNYKTISLVNYNEHTINKLIHEINEDINSYTKQIIIKTGSYKTVFEKNKIMDLLHPFIEANFDGHQYLYEENKYKKLISKKIFSDKLNIIDKPNIKEIGFFNFVDDQNTLTQDLKIIDKGVYKSPITNNQSKKFSNNKSTGHDSSGSCSFNKIIIQEEQKNKIEELWAKKDEYIVIKYLSGIHSGFDNINADFSLEFYGLYYKDAKLQGYIKQGMVAGNFVDHVLNNIKNVYNDRDINLYELSPTIELDKKLKYTFE